MSDNETTLSEQDEADLAEMMKAIEEPLDRTVLEIWHEILKNIEVQSLKRIEPGFANYVLKSWPAMRPEQISTYYRLFHNLLLKYRVDLEEQLRLHPDALKNFGPVGTDESDAIKNRDVYVELMFQWNLTTARIEHVWDADAEDAYPLLAAMADAQAYVTGGTGLLQQLNTPQVQFQWTNADQDELTTRVIEAAEAEFGD
jgi:hypothetical protein